MSSILSSRKPFGIDYMFKVSLKKMTLVLTSSLLTPVASELSFTEASPSRTSRSAHTSIQTSYPPTWISACCATETKEELYCAISKHLTYTQSKLHL